MTSVETLRKRRKGALTFELVCFGIAAIAPVIGWFLLRDRLDAMGEIPVALWVPLIPPLLLFLAGIGFHRHRRGIERQLRDATGARGASR